MRRRLPLIFACFTCLFAAAPAEAVEVFNPPPFQDPRHPGNPVIPGAFFPTGSARERGAWRSLEHAGIGCPAGSGETTASTTLTASVDLSDTFVQIWHGSANLPDAPGYAPTSWRKAGDVPAGQTVTLTDSCFGGSPSDGTTSFTWFERAWATAREVYTGRNGAEAVGHSEIGWAVRPGFHSLEIRGGEGDVTVTIGDQSVTLPAGQNYGRFPLSRVLSGDVDADVTVNGAYTNWQINLVESSPPSNVFPALDGANYVAMARLVGGEPMTLPYHAHMPGWLDVAIASWDGQIVRNMVASREVPAGPGRTSWDGRGPGGALLPNGNYLILEKLAAFDGRLTGSAAFGITVDTTQPELAGLAAPRAVKTALSFKASDALTGVADASLEVDGRAVKTRAAGGRSGYLPRGGWKRGRTYRYSVRAVDRVGNVVTKRGRFKLPAKRKPSRRRGASRR